MDHCSFTWKTKNYILYCDLLVFLNKTKSKKKSKEIKRDLEILKNGYRPLKYA